MSVDYQKKKLKDASTFIKIVYHFCQSCYKFLCTIWATKRSLVYNVKQLMYHEIC